MFQQPFIYEDLLGNLTDLKNQIDNIIHQNQENNQKYSVDLRKSTVPEELAILQIYVHLNGKDYQRELIIFRIPRKDPSFTLQWGSFPLLISKVIHKWLSKLDTCLERAEIRTKQLKEELVKTVFQPTKIVDGL
jgi:hypothetical protein